MDKIKNTINKSKVSLDSLKEKNKLNMEIEKAQKEKMKIFANAGIKLYEMVRKEEVIQKELIYLFDNMIELDKTIYESNLKLEKIESKKEIECECGSTLRNDSKFCSNCGKKIEEEPKDLICKFCFNEIEEDSNFCVCCGNKVDKNI